MKKSANGRFQFKVNYHEGDIQRRKVDQQEGRIPKYIIKVEITDNRITEQLHTPLRIFTEYAKQGKYDDNPRKDKRNTHDAG